MSSDKLMMPSPIRLVFYPWSAASHQLITPGIHLFISQQREIVERENVVSDLGNVKSSLLTELSDGNRTRDLVSDTFD